MNKAFFIRDTKLISIKGGNKLTKQSKTKKMPVFTTLPLTNVVNQEMSNKMKEINIKEAKEWVDYNEK